MIDWRNDPGFKGRRDEVRLAWIDRMIGDQTSGCESPIEALLEDALRLMPVPAGCRRQPGSRIANTPLMLPNVSWAFEKDDPRIPEGRYVLILEQAEVGEYRVDFLIAAKLGGAVRLIVVECDGHDYHERTKEQAEHDKSRDRWFVANGYTVLRFTGREIWRDPVACTKEISSLLFQWDEAAGK